LSTIAEPPADTTPVQNFGTAGIKPLNRPGQITRAFMAAVAFIERLNLAMFTPCIREGMGNQKDWENKFYEEAEAWRNR
jgi:hypothetical protein